MTADNLWREMDAFVAFNQSKGLSPRTIDGYNKTLRHFLKWAIEGCDDGEVTARCIREFLVHKRSQGLARSSIQTYWAALRAFFTFLVLDEVIAKDQDPMRLVKPPKGRSAEIVPLTPDETRRLLGSFAKDDLAEQRNYTMCLLMLDTGLRVSEVIHLRLEDVAIADGKVRVSGKGGKVRHVYVGERAGKALVDYVANVRRWMANGYSTLFPPLRSRSEKMNACHLSTIMKKKMDEVGIARANSSCHRLRHTFAVNYIRNGGDVFSLQKLLGHSSLEMTRRYVMLADEDVKEAHRKASPIDNLELG